MPAARSQPERHPGHVRPSLDHAVPGDRDARAPALRRRPGRIGGADPERALLHQDVAERALVRRHHALDDRDVPPLRGAREELRLEILLRLRSLGDDQEPRGLPVQPVDDERPAGGPRALEVGPHHAVGGALPLVLGPDREEPGRLLDDEERVVLVDQAERRGEGRGRRRSERDRVAGGDGRARIVDDLAPDAHPARHEPGAEPPARRVGELLAEPGHDAGLRRVHEVPARLARAAGQTLTLAIRLRPARKSASPSPRELPGSQGLTPLRGAEAARSSRGHGRGPPDRADAVLRVPGPEPPGDVAAHARLRAGRGRLRVRVRGGLRGQRVPRPVRAGLPSRGAEPRDRRAHAPQPRDGGARGPDLGPGPRPARRRGRPPAPAAGRRGARSG